MFNHPCKQLLRETVKRLGELGCRRYTISIDQGTVADLLRCPLVLQGICLICEQKAKFHWIIMTCTTGFVYHHHMKGGDWLLLQNHVSEATDSLQLVPTETYFARVRQQLATQGQAYVRVTGNSMWPLLHHLRDGVVIVPPGKIRRGDIVLFDRRNGRYALHRVVGLKPDGFTMAGDHQWHVERKLPYDQILGVVRYIHRGGRCIPAENILIKMYAWAVTLLTLPCISLDNVSQELGAREGLLNLLSNAFVPTWDKALSDSIHNTALSIVERLRFASFSFAPNREATGIFDSMVNK